MSIKKKFLSELANVLQKYRAEIVINKIDDIVFDINGERIVSDLSLLNFGDVIRLSDKIIIHEHRIKTKMHGIPYELVVKSEDETLDPNKTYDGVLEEMARE